MCDSHFQVVRKQNCTLSKACRQSWELQMHNKLMLGDVKLMLASAEGDTVRLRLVEEFCAEKASSCLCLSQ